MFSFLNDFEWYKNFLFLNWDYIRKKLPKTKKKPKIDIKKKIDNFVVNQKRFIYILKYVSKIQ